MEASVASNGWEGGSEWKGGCEECTTSDPSSVTEEGGREGPASSSREKLRGFAFKTNSNHIMHMFGFSPFSAFETLICSMQCVGVWMGVVCKTTDIVSKIHIIVGAILAAVSGMDLAF